MAPVRRETWAGRSCLCLELKSVVNCVINLNLMVKRNPAAWMYEIQNEKIVKRATWAGIEALGLELKSVVNCVINLNLMVKRNPAAWMYEIH